MHPVRQYVAAMHPVRKYVTLPAALLFWAAGVAASLGFGWIAVSGLYEGVSLSAFGATAEGVVVRHDARTCPAEDSERRPCFREVVRFAGPDNEPVEFRSPTWSSSKRYRAGARVEVLYHPDRPDVARINNVTTLFVGPLLVGFISLAGLFLLVGVPLFLLRLYRLWKQAVEVAGDSADGDPSPDPAG